ncbi:MAG: hypothetical protein AB1626_02435 [Candidatus Micrarchaeota archaeon]
MPVLIFSTECPAGRNIAAQLIQKGFEQAEEIRCGEKSLPAWKRDEIRLIEVRERLSRDVEYLSQLNLPKASSLFSCRGTAPKTGRPALLFIQRGTGDLTHNEEEIPAS